MYPRPNNGLNASFGPGECGCGLLKIALSASRENGQKKIKRQCQKHTKRENLKEIQYQGPNNAFERVAWVWRMWMELMEMALGASCKSGQEKLKNNAKNIQKIKFKKIQYRGPNKAFERVV